MTKNALMINKEFNNKLTNMIENNEVITNYNGSEKYLPTIEDNFRQIYVSKSNTNYKYAKVRSAFPKNYFISEKGTLLKFLADGTIRLISNNDKESKRITYSIWFSSLKREKTLRNYQIMAIVFECTSTYSADKALNKYGIDALGSIVEVHHIKGLSKNIIDCLQMCTQQEHCLLSTSINLKKETKAIDKLREVSDVFDGNPNDIIIVTDKAFNAHDMLPIKDIPTYSKIVETSIDHDAIRIELASTTGVGTVYGKIEGSDNEVLILEVDLSTRIAKVYDTDGNHISIWQKEVVDCLNLV